MRCIKHIAGTIGNLSRTDGLPATKESNLSAQHRYHPVPMGTTEPPPAYALESRRSRTDNKSLCFPIAARGLASRRPDTNMMLQAAQRLDVHCKADCRKQDNLHHRGCA